MAGNQNGNPCLTYLRITAMAIWTYEESKAAESTKSLGEQCSVRVCPYCGALIQRIALSCDHGSWFPEGNVDDYYGNFCSDVAQLQACLVCGWWVSTLINGRGPWKQHDDGFLNMYRSCGTLRDLDLNDISTPLEEVRAYLTAKYGDRFHVHPKKYEDIVGSVFSDFGFRVRVTSYSGDDGIDAMVLDGKDDAVVGIQVKRQREKITAEQIRAFVGALVLKGLTAGVYVTTSSYQIGAKRAANSAERLPGIAISLLDSQRFYDALKITSRTTFVDPSDASSPYFRCWKEMSRQYIADTHVDAPLVYTAAW
ncbi:MAG: restriction endonuclease [Terracidiphilus sp.]